MCATIANSGETLNSEFFLLTSQLSSLRFQIARHQRAHSFPHILALIKHGMGLVDNRSYDTVAAGELPGGTSRRIPFSHRQGTGRDGHRAFAAAEPFAKGAITAVARETRRHQVAQTAEAIECFRLGSRRNAQPPDLNHGPRY